MSSPTISDGPKVVCDDDSQSLMACLCPKERASSTNAALLFEVKGFSGTFSSSVCLIGEKSSSLAFSMSKD